MISNRHYSNKIYKNALKMIAGTATAQIIAIGFTPAITRIYSPEQIGTLSTFISISMIVTPLLSLSYPLAIILPKSEKEAREIAWATIIISFLLFLFITIFTVISGNHLLTKLGLSEIAIYSPLIPIYSLFSVWIQINQHLIFRRGHFGLAAKINIVHELILNLSKSIFGLISPNAAVLLTSQTASSFVYAILTVKKGLMKPGRPRPQKNKNLKNYINILIKHKDFPLYRAPEAAISATTLSLPLILLTSLYGANVAGFYGISKMALKIPNNLLVNSIGNVLYPEYSHARNNKKPIGMLAINATLIISIIGFSPYLLIFLYGEEIFGFIFGNEWQKAGELASWLAIWMYSALCTAAAVKLIPIVNMNKQFLVYRIGFIITSASSLIIGFIAFNSYTISIAILSITSTILCIGLILYVIYIAKSQDEQLKH